MLFQGEVMELSFSILQTNKMANFTKNQIEQVWQKAKVVSNNNPDLFRQDYAGAWIRRDLYGNRESKYGWEIDHCKPVSKGGTDDLGNLYPLHWRNNQKKGNDYPNWKTIITSNGNQNLEMERSWYI